MWRGVLVTSAFGELLLVLGSTSGNVIQREQKIRWLKNVHSEEPLDGETRKIFPERTSAEKRVSSHW